MLLNVLKKKQSLSNSVIKHW